MMVQRQSPISSQMFQWLLADLLDQVQAKFFLQVRAKLTYTEEESREITDIKEIAQAELEVAICDIILGNKSIDTYDAAIETAKANGYDRWTEIVQGAYDRYISKFEN